MTWTVRWSVQARDQYLANLARVAELGQLLLVTVDVLTPNGLPAKFRAQVVAEAQAL